MREHNRLAMEMQNPFEAKGTWYKANLHTHTTTSDGEVSVAERVSQYMGRGYQVLAITDHRLTNDVSGLSTDSLLVLSGLEIHPVCPGHYENYHLIGLDVPAEFEVPDDSADVNLAITRVREAGGEVILSHPYWSGLTLEHLVRVQGHIAIEVYNATCSRFGKGISSVHWDNLLNAGRMLPAIAVDDTHRGRDIFMGWTMIKARELNVAAVMEALRVGRYYSSCGPVIEDFRVDNGNALLQCSPVSEVRFMCHSWKGRSLYADGGEPITSAELALRHGSEFVRAEVVDSLGRRAWTNPLTL